MATTDVLDPSKGTKEVGETLGLGDMPTVGGLAPSLRGPNAFGRIQWINREMTASEQHVKKFRRAGLEVARFIAGDQLDEVTRAELKGARRPDTAINITQRYIRYVSGTQRRSPQALIFRPTVVDQQQQQLVGEFVTQGFEWAYRLANGTHVLSEVMDDMLGPGMGWSDKYLDKLKDPRGLTQYVRVPWDEMYWPECAMTNLAPTRWRARENWIEREEAVRRWPKSEALINAACAASNEDRQLPQQDVTVYTTPYIQSVPIDKSRSDAEQSRRNQVKVCQFQWYEDKDGYAFTDPITGETTWLGVFDFHRYKRRLAELMPGMAPLEGEPMPHRIVQVTYLLNRKHELAPPARLPGDLFTLQCLTGHWDHAERMFYGFARLLMDPQKYANSFFRQSLEIMAVTAKGGAIAQSDAFKDAAQRDTFKKIYSQPGSVPIVAPEALEKGKIKPKEPGQFPQAAMAMLQFCLQSLDNVTGFTASSLGAAVSDTPALSMQQGQEVGRILLAKEFDNLSLYRKEEGKGFFAFLSLLADGRLIRIGGEATSQVLPLVRKPFLLEYDLWLDDTEHDPNMRKLYQNFLLQALPALMKSGMFVPQMFDYLPFPYKIKQAMIQQMTQQAQEKKQAAMMGINLGGRGAPVDPRLTQAKIQKLQADATLHMARAAAVRPESRREDFRSVVDAIGTMAGHAHEASRRDMERQHHRDTHRLETSKATAKTLTELLSILHEPAQQNGGGEQ